MQFNPSWYTFGLSQDLPQATSGWLVWTTKTCVVQMGSCHDQLLRDFFFSGLLHDIIWTRDWMVVLFSSVCMHATDASVTRKTFTPSSLLSHVQCVKRARSWRRHVGCFPKDQSIYVLKSNLVKPKSLCNMHTTQKTVNPHQPRKKFYFHNYRFFRCGLQQHSH